MRNEMKVGLVLGIVIVVGLIVYLVGREEAAPGPEVTQAPVQQEEPAAPVQPQPEPTYPVAPPVTVPPEPIEPEPIEPLAPSTQPPVEAPEPTEPVEIEPRVEPVEPVEPIEEPVREPRYHVVAEGESLYSISEDYYGSGRWWQQIYEANRSVIANPDRVRAGLRLRIPYPDEIAGR